MVEMTPAFDCLRCGKTFLRGRLGRPAMYCSRTCRQRAAEERLTATQLSWELHCLLLGAAFQRGLLLPLLQAVGGDTSQAKDSKETAPDPKIEG